MCRMTTRSKPGAPPQYSGLPSIDQRLVRLPGAQLERPRSGRCRPQPFVPHVAVLLVLERELPVDHRADGCGQAVEEERRRVGLVQLDREGPVVDRPDPLVDVVRREAELAEDERWRLVQLDHALQRPGGVLRGQRIAAVEDDAVLDLERVGPAVVGDLPALGDMAAQVRDVVDRVGDQAVVHVRRILGAGELERLGRIERDQVGDLERHDQGVLRRRGGRGCRGQRQGSGGAEREASQLEHRVSLIGGAPHPAH